MEDGVDEVEVTWGLRLERGLRGSLPVLTEEGGSEEGEEESDVPVAGGGETPDGGGGIGNEGGEGGGGKVSRRLRINTVYSVVSH